MAARVRYTLFRSPVVDPTAGVFESTDDTTGFIPMAIQMRMRFGPNPTGHESRHFGDTVGRSPPPTFRRPFTLAPERVRRSSDCWHLHAQTRIPPSWPWILRRSTGLFRPLVSEPTVGGRGIAPPTTAAPRVRIRGRDDARRTGLCVGATLRVPPIHFAPGRNALPSPRSARRLLAQEPVDGPGVPH